MVKANKSTSDAITIKEVSKTYAHKKQPHLTKKALDSVSLTIKKGELFGLIGANGAGKTTLIGILTSLVKSDSGSINIFDHNLASNPVEAKQMMGVVPQEININTFETPLQVILTQAGFYGISSKDALPWAEELLQVLDLWEKRRHQVRQLSGGMKRRLMIARALINKPKVLFLDEPTAGVDIHLRSKIWDFIKKINNEGTTIILTTHYLEEAESLCDRIAVIHHGQIIETTDIKTLLRQQKQESYILDFNQVPANLPNSLNLDALDDQTYRLTLTGTQTLNEVFSELSKQKIDVNSMRNESNRLEQYIRQLLQGEKTA